MPPSIDIGLAPGAPGPPPGMPKPPNVATSIHACATGGLTTCEAWPLAAPAATANPIPTQFPIPLTRFIAPPDT